MTTSPVPADFVLDLNLVEAANHELRFLKLVDQHPVLFNGRVIENAKRRYELLWLPLFKTGDFDGQELQAPLDIEWVWQAHILYSTVYEKDCLNIVSREVDHRILSGHRREQGLERARTIWQKAYAKEPFEVELQEPLDVVPQFRSKLQLNLLEAGTRLRNFSYCVSLPHYSDAKFLMSALHRYKQHLSLASLKPWLALVPCCDVDLLWKTHLLHPATYKADMIATFGLVLTHPDTNTSHSDISKYLESEKITKSLFEEHGMTFSRAGTLYHGEVPDTPPALPANPAYRNLAIFQFEVDLLNFEVENFQKGKTFSFVISQNGGKIVWKKRIKGGTRSLGGTQTPLATFGANTDDNNSITLAFHQKKLLSKSPKLSHTIDLNECLSAALNLDSTTNEFRIPVPIFGPANRKVFMTIKTRAPPQLIGYRFTLDPDPEFAEFAHPAEVLAASKTLLKREHLVLPSLPCELSVYRIFDCSGRSAFTCRVLHARPSVLMVLEVVNFHGHTVASAQLVENELFPSRVDIEDASNCVTTDPLGHEIFLLIRGLTDWGICIGIENAQDNRPEDLDSVLQIKVFKLVGRRGWCDVKKTENSLLLHTYPGEEDRSIEVNPQLGQISLPSDAEDIPECLALGLSLMLMPSLCNFATLLDCATSSTETMEEQSNLISLVLRCPSLSRYIGSSVHDIPHAQTASDT